MERDWAEWEAGSRPVPGGAGLQCWERESEPGGPGGKRSRPWFGQAVQEKGREEKGWAAGLRGLS